MLDTPGREEFGSPEEHGIPECGNEESFQSLWVDWKQEIVEANQIDWRQEIINAKPDECDILDIQDTDLYLTVPTGMLPRGVTREDIQENWQDVSKAKVNSNIGIV